MELPPTGSLGTLHSAGGWDGGGRLAAGHQGRVLSPPRGRRSTPVWAGRRSPDSLPEGGPCWRGLSFPIHHWSPAQYRPQLEFRLKLGNYLFFFLMYKTCERKSSMERPREEALGPHRPSGWGQAEADEQGPRPRDTYIKHLCLPLTC